MRKTVKTLVTLAVTGLLSISLALGDSSLAKANNVSDSNALARDAAEYAKDYGVTKAQAIRNLNLQENRLIGLASDLKNKLGDRYVDSRLVHGATVQLELEVTGNKEIPIDLPASISGASINVVYGSPYNEKQIDSFINGINWQHVTSGVQGVYYDASSRKVILEVSSDLNKAKADVENNLDKVASTNAVDIPVEVQKTSEIVPANRGGRILSDCTSGFTVKEKRTGRLGMVTAGHCQDNQSYYWFNGGGPFPMRFVRDAKAPTADLQWHTTSAQPIEPIFHASPKDARVQKKKGVGIVGQYVCRYGKTSNNKRCGKVLSIKYRPNTKELCSGYNVCSNVYSLVDAPVIEGDSGGPWFIGNTAHGITNGYSRMNGRVRTIYTRVWYLNTLGVDLFLSK